jgi:replicative DNA helicase
MPPINTVPGIDSGLLVEYAKKYGVCTLMTSQINRLHREAPTMEGLRGSGEIEENVDIACVLARKPEDTLFQNDGREILELTVQKNRIHGMLDKISMAFDRTTLHIDEHPTGP